MSSENIKAKYLVHPLHFSPSPQRKHIPMKLLEFDPGFGSTRNPPSQVQQRVLQPIRYALTNFYSYLGSQQTGSERCDMLNVTNDCIYILYVLCMDLIEDVKRCLMDF